MHRKLILAITLIGIVSLAVVAQPTVPHQDGDLARIEIRFTGFSGSMGNYDVYIDEVKTTSFFGAVGSAIIDLQPGEHLVRCMSSMGSLFKRVKEANETGDVGVVVEKGMAIYLKFRDYHSRVMYFLEEEKSYKEATSTGKPVYVNLVAKGGSK